jgi:hypothetical protein
VSCPCFSPTHPRSRDSGSKYTLPLGDSFAGLCLADPSHPAEPDESRLALCNLGYARGECPHVPAGSADAVRFALSSDDGQSLQIYYVIERGHHPVEHGLLIYSTAARTIAPDAASPLPEQVAAYAASYLHRIESRRKELLPAQVK